MNATPPSPTWHIADHHELMFCHGKSFSAGFDPKDRDAPFLLGSEHGGLHNVSAERILRESWLQSDLERNGLGWLLELVDKVWRGESFTLDDVVTAAARNGFPARPLR